MMSRVRAEQLAMTRAGYGVYTEPGLWNRYTNSISQSASEQALAEAHAEIARLTAETQRVKEELKEAPVGLSYGRMCEKELFALRSWTKRSRLPQGKLGIKIPLSVSVSANRVIE